MSRNESKDFSDVEARRSKSSTRRMSAARRFGYAIGEPILRALVALLVSSYRIDVVKGDAVVRRILADRGRAYAPCYYHQQHLACGHLMRDWIRQGFRACYIVSASVDGEVPARIARSWGAEVIRGSAAHTGALVMRDAQQMMKNGVSIVTTSDGPVGPRFEVKTGTVVMARIGGAPLVPIACAAKRAWYMDTWDRFVIPKPFARICVAIGEPIEVPRDLPMDQVEGIRARLQEAIDSLIDECHVAVGSGKQGNWK